MKPTLFLFLFLFISISKIKGQDSLKISSHLDSLPSIKIEKNIPLLVLGIYTGALFFGASCNNYIIGRKKYLNPKPMKPYFNKLGDSTVLGDYQQHRSLRAIYFTGYSVGAGLFTYGLLKSVKSIFSVQNSSTNTGGSEIYVSLGCVLAATVVRIVSFSHLHKAVNRYNSLISSPKTSFDIKPSQEGLGFRIHF